MAEPTFAQIELIRARVTDWDQTDEAITADLNAPTIDNPVPQGTVPRTVYSSDVLGFLDVAALAKIKLNTAFPQIREDIKNGRVPEMLEWVRFSAGCGDITPEQANNIAVFILTPIPNPHWTAQISWAQDNLGRAADTADVWTARRAD